MEGWQENVKDTNIAETIKIKRCPIIYTKSIININQLYENLKIIQKFTKNTKKNLHNKKKIQNKKFPR